MRLALYHNLPSGGAKRTLLEAARRLSGRHRLEAYTLSCAEHEFADLRPFVASHRVFQFDPVPMARSPFGRVNPVLRCANLWRLTRVARRIASEIERGGYDAVLVHPCRFEQSPSLLRCLRETASVYYCHEPLRSLYEPMPPRPYDDEAVSHRRILNSVDPLPAMFRRALRYVDRANIRSAGAVLVNSRFSSQAVLDAYGVHARVAYHGVDADFFRPLGIEKRNVVVSVGSLTPLKGFDFLIRAMAELPPQTRPVLAIASNFQNAAEKAFLSTLAVQLGVSVSLSGFVTDGDLLRLYNEARVVAYAPVREPFGLVPLEAMACGTPVVAVAEGGIPESVVHEQTGLLSARDPARFAAAVRHLLENPALASQIGRNGRQHVLDRWTWDSAIRSLESHLEYSARRCQRAAHEPRASAHK